MHKYLASVLMLLALPIMVFAETVKVNIQLNGKTRSPKTNLWMGVLEVQIGKQKFF